MEHDVDTKLLVQYNAFSVRSSAACLQTMPLAAEIDIMYDEDKHWQQPETSQVLAPIVVTWLSRIPGDACCRG